MDNNNRARGITKCAAGAGESLALAGNAADAPVLFLAKDAAHAAAVADELAFFAPDINAHWLPDWDVLPFDTFAPSAETASRRIAALAAMAEGGITIASGAAALAFLPPPLFVAARAFDLRAGGRADLAQLKSKLANSGYENVGRVGAPGEFASCGGQLDVFPPDASLPFRLVMFDDEIEQIRIFDPRTQRSLRQVQRIRLLPANEFDMSAEGVERFRAECRRRFGGGGENIRPGSPSFAPLFFEQPATLFDYLTPQHLLFVDGGCRRAAADFLEQAREREHTARVYENRPVPPVADLFLSAEEFDRRIKENKAAAFCHVKGDNMPPVAAQAGGDNPYRQLANAAKEETAKGRKVVVVMGGEGQKIAVAESLVREKIAVRVVDGFAEVFNKDNNNANGGGVFVTAGVLRGGFVSAKKQLAIFAESDIHGAPPKTRRTAHTIADFADADDISPGDLVVHRQHGIGICHGLKAKTLVGVSGEFLELEYAGGQRLWLPVAQMHHLCRHHGAAMLSVLGGAGWRRARKRAEKNARDTAARLLEINARRESLGGKSIKPDEAILAKFAARFPYPETPDQARAIRETLDDMRAPKTTDRLIAADVGFGKTEIAMRAACACALSGAQTAVLAPTTLLSEQHARNFADRFAGFPVAVAALNRHTDARAKRTLLHKVAEGTIDILIGTHALLHSSVKYKNLGLVVIDEEHRFGVRQKEHFKSLRANVDMLSLSATPIPRTMAMAMDGLRDLSTISTPPAGRLPIQTMVMPFSRAAVVEACQRELLRGGQVYFVHNDIAGINEMARQLQEWLPQASIVIAHGRMAAAETESAMRRFLRREASVLLCTAIIESGLDIVNVNTVIINRADKMGAARLHQLRGRVGRGQMQGYAYFLTPTEGAATESGEERLLAVQECAQLGGGFLLAMRDLEIRGAGEILGERQSGDIAGVGVAMYQKLLRAAAREIKGAPPEQVVAVDLGAPAILPQEYANAPGERMRYYWKLGNCNSPNAVDDIVEEWRDRFGKPPMAALVLAASHRLRLFAEQCGASAIRAAASGETMMDFPADTPHRDAILQKLKDGECRLANDGGSVALPEVAKDNPMARAEQARNFLEQICQARRPAS